MSAKRLGRFTAAVFVVLGMAFGGLVLADAGVSGSASVAADTTTVVVTVAQKDFEWG